jgi:hypothetical protein
MKKVTRSIFLIAVLVMISAFSMTVYAEPGDEGDEITLNYQLTASKYFNLYISESDDEAGKELLYGKDVYNYFSGSTKLNPGKTYYLHISSNGEFTSTLFISKFVLNGTGLEFSNHSNTLATNLTDFRYSYTGFGQNYINVEKNMVDYLDIPSSLKPARWLSLAKQYNKPIYISAVINPTQSVLSAKTSGANDSVDIIWNSLQGATSYSVERSTTAGGPYTPIAFDLTETNYTDKSVTANTTYYYIVKAKLSDTETVTSSEVSGTPTTETPTVESKLKVVLEPEEKLQLSVDDHLDENTNMTWTSSDSTVAQVDGNGVVTAIKAGNAVIHVQSPDGSYSNDINVLVVDNADDYRLAVDLKVGKTSRLTVDDLTNTLNVTWNSSDASVATVSSKGVVTAKGKGLTLAKAADKDGNVVGQVYVRVRE